MFDTFYADFARLEAILGLPNDFITHLLEEDDWSFVIKGHAVIEAAITHLLNQNLDQRLAPAIERMPMGTGKAGKLGFIQQLGLLPQPCIVFIRRFAELRNGLMHGTASFRFNLGDYVEQLSAGDRRTLVRQLAATLDLESEAEIERQGESFLLRDPKPGFGFAIFAVLAQTLFSLDPTERGKAKTKAKDSAGATALVILVALAVGVKNSQRLWSGKEPPAT